MHPRKHAELLLAKAAQDEYMLDLLLGDANAPLEVFGFHAQQAVEKLLKAVLAAGGLEYPRTHRLSEVYDLIRAADFEIPTEFDAICDLTPYAVEFRYGAVPVHGEALLSKPSVRASVRRLRGWVESTVDKATLPGGTR